MNEQLLKVENLHAGIEGKEILKGINLTVNRGHNGTQRLRQKHSL